MKIGKWFLALAFVIMGGCTNTQQIEDYAAQIRADAARLEAAVAQVRADQQASGVEQDPKVSKVVADGEAAIAKLREIAEQVEAAAASGDYGQIAADAGAVLAPLSGPYAPYVLLASSLIAALLGKRHGDMQAKGKIESFNEGARRATAEAE